MLVTSRAMRLSDDKIKEAILHPEPGVRLRALLHFTESFTDDPSIMPLVIQAAEQFGGCEIHDLLVHCTRLPQTPTTIDWLINQLRQPFNTQEEDQDNQRYTLASILLESDPQLLARRHNDILALPAFPEPLRPLLAETLKLEFSDWPTLWAAFEELGRESRVEGRITRVDRRRFHQLVKAMARHRDQGAPQVLALLGRKFKGFDASLMEWLEPEIVKLAGWMRLQDAIPALLKRISGHYEAVQDVVGTALVQIGGDAVIDAIVKKWNRLDDDRRLFLIEPLDCIHSDRAASAGLSLLMQARDIELHSSLAYAVLGQFAAEGMEPVRRLLELHGEQGVSDYWDLRYRLVSTATIMGLTFPEYQEWHEESVATDYGLKKLLDHTVPYRIADSFSEEAEDERPVRHIRPRSRAIYQIKVTLKDVQPPIWRRLLVPDCTLDDLHQIIQVVMGWRTYHLYSFGIGQTEFTDPQYDEGELNMEDATAVSLGGLPVCEKQKLLYTYDFGDNWKHEIVVEKILDREKGQAYPLCLAGKRACPPEDVGGRWGYAEYLEAMADPQHERHDEFLEWRGEFDPEAFDVEAVNQELRKFFR